MKSVAGISGVVELNSITSRMIFDHNKGAHEFFVEEGWAHNWMYPYLEPYGLIMKINAEPIDKLSAVTVARDRAFWRDHVQRLQNAPGYATTAQAQITFSKLRSAIAGLYVYRQMYVEAEEAFRQAIKLCPASPEANYRLVDMYARQGRFGEAAAVLESYLPHVPAHQKDNAEAFLRQLQGKMQNNVPNDTARKPVDPQQ